VSFFDLLNGSGLLMLQGFGIAQGALIQQLLKDTTVVETELYFRDQFVRDVNRKAASFDAPVKDMTGMLFARATGFAMFAHTGASPQAQRTQRGRPEKGGLFSEPLLDIGESLSSTWHGACVPYNTHACQLKNENPQSHSQLRVSRQKLARPAHETSPPMAVSRKKVSEYDVSCQLGLGLDPRSFTELFKGGFEIFDYAPARPSGNVNPHFKWLSKYLLALY